MTKKIGLGIILAMMATAASAATNNGGCSQPPQNFFQELISIFGGSSGSCGGSGGGVKQVNAPEIDPSSAMAGLTLMGAGLTVLRGRRKIK